MKFLYTNWLSSTCFRREIMIFSNKLIKRRMIIIFFMGLFMCYNALLLSFVVKDPLHALNMRKMLGVFH